MVAPDLRVLVVDDDAAVRATVVRCILDYGYEVEGVGSAEEAIQTLEMNAYPVIFSDWRMPGMDGFALLERIGKLNPDAKVIIITGHGTIPSAVDAMRRGAYDYLTKPFHLEEIRSILDRIARLYELDASGDDTLPEALSDEHVFCGIVGSTRPMHEVFRLIRKVARARSNVLIRGESGTGKELVARAIHTNGPDAEQPFVAVNCGAIPPTLIESELFGHNKGAFTDAKLAKKGLFRSAHGGTIFLDEVAELGLDMQVKLLRTLQEREVRPVGAELPVKISVRVIAATNKNLEDMMREGKFRSDLYYRLNVIPIEIPPLCERKGDIGLLAYHFIRKHYPHEDPSWRVSDDALNVLRSYSWPGNVRELESVIERAIVLGESDIITSRSLPPTLLEAQKDRKDAEDDSIRSLDDVERHTILKTLRYTSGDKQAAARLLKIDRSTLYRKLQKYSLDVK